MNGYFAVTNQSRRHLVIGIAESENITHKYVCDLTYQRCRTLARQFARVLSNLEPESILRWLLCAVYDEDFNGTVLRFEPQAELFRQRSENRGSIGIRWRWGID